jgi:CheY-like chemotaxis protein
MKHASLADDGSKSLKQAPALRVLVIEDNPDLATLFSDIFKVLGCITDVALNAKTGLESALDNRPDLVFCDLRLPGEKDGCDFARDFRAETHFAHVPLIAVTGSGEEEDFVRARAAGFDQIFSKPFKFSEIQKVVQDLQNSDK